jgi:predicted dehydrogenase/putative sterol carrier protein
MMEKINVGIIGCGSIADLHYPGYRAHPSARIHAVCDAREEVAAQRARQWGDIKAYTDYRRMLADPEIDAVEILTPHRLHEVMVVDAARAGKHIALQKPMTISLASADRMLAAVRQAGIILRVTDNYVFYPPIALARRMIDDGAIGTPTNLRIKMISGTSGGWDVPASAWEWRMAENAAGRGMQTFDHGHHLWTTAWFLMGDIERVAAWIDSVDGIIDSPATVMWKYRQGVGYGMCEYAHATEMHIPSRYYANDEWIEITGSRGIIMINRCTGNIKDGPGVRVFDGNRWQDYADVKTDWGEGFIGATHNFIEAIQGTAQPLLSAEQGRDILKLTLAIAKSSRVRREVYVDELDARFPWWHTRRQIRRDQKSTAPRSSLLSWLGLGAGDSGYAGQARALTEELTQRFKPEAVEGWEACIGLQLLADGDVPEMRYGVSIRNATAVIESGGWSENAELVIKVPAGTWAAILLGKKRIETAFLQGKLKLEGKAEYGLKLRDAFGI